MLTAAHGFCAAACERGYAIRITYGKMVADYEGRCEGC